MLKNNKEIININRYSWNLDYKSFLGWCFLPSWGPYGVGSNLTILGDIKKKKILEIACGSGHSLDYLLNNGASLVVGIDFSKNQIKSAKTTLKKHQNFKLIQKQMEEKINIRDFDIVFSIYGLGWSTNIKKTLKNIYNYLKPNGLFVFSWDNKYFTCVENRKKFVFLKDSYYKNNFVFMKNWGNGTGAYVNNYSIEEWVDFLVESGFTIKKIIEPNPVNFEENLKFQSNDIDSYYNIKKVSCVPPTLIFVCSKK